MSRLVPFGRFYKPFGVRGEVRFGPYIGGLEPKQLKSGYIVAPADKPDRSRPIDFTFAKKHPRGWIVHPAGYDNPEDVAKLSGSELYMERESLPKATEDSYYPFDIEGTEVFDEDGNRLGLVESVLETGANDVWEVRKPDGGELLIPVIEPVILKIDFDAGRATVRLLEGLEDL